MIAGRRICEQLNYIHFLKIHEHNIVNIPTVERIIHGIFQKQNHVADDDQLSVIETVQLFLNVLNSATFLGCVACLDLRPINSTPDGEITL